MSTGLGAIEFLSLSIHSLGIVGWRAYFSPLMIANAAQLNPSIFGVDSAAFV